jgi:hypothetical protein
MLDLAHDENSYHDKTFCPLRLISSIFQQDFTILVCPSSKLLSICFTVKLACNISPSIVNYFKQTWVIFHWDYFPRVSASVHLLGWGLPSVRLFKPCSIIPGCLYSKRSSFSELKFVIRPWIFLAYIQIMIVFGQCGRGKIQQFDWIPLGIFHLD